MRILVVLALCFLLPATVFSADPQVGELVKELKQNPAAETVKRLLPKINAALLDEDAAIEALPVVEQAAAILLADATEKLASKLPAGANSAARLNRSNSAREWKVAASLLKTVARMRFEQAEPEKASAHLAALRKLYQRIDELLPPDVDSSERILWRNELALEYLRGEQVDRALELVAELVDESLLTNATWNEALSAVAGGLNRRLELLPTEQRYEVLYAWSMPAAERQSARVFSSLASIDAPPAVFARELGERPRENAFPIPAVGGVPGLFSSGWALAKSAAESGRLRRLTSELEELEKKNGNKEKASTAGHLLLLARIADESGDAKQLQTELETQLKAFATLDRANTEPADALPKSMALLQWAVVGAACVEREELCGMGQRIFETLDELIGASPSEYFRPTIRRARAIAISKQHDLSTWDLLHDPKLRFWVPAGEENATRSATGAAREIWLRHEDHLLHLAGTHNDFLCFRYPLSGEFEFQVDAQHGGAEPTSGNLSYGGLAFDIDGVEKGLRVYDLGMKHLASRPFPFVRDEQWPTYQRLVLRCSSSEFIHLVNGHAAWTQAVSEETIPWLALRCRGDSIPAFRNFRLTGNIGIPREVKMSAGTKLSGWFTQFYPSLESAPDARKPSIITQLLNAVQNGPSVSSLVVTPADWSLVDGVIYGQRRGEMLRAAVPGALTYFRPLQNDESIEYEFFYEPGRYAVHPALGRLAFLVESGGVRVHWMTNGESEWTGLSEDNATIEPLNRRGPRPVPLKFAGWNRAVVALEGNTLSLKLNDVEVYSRKMERENSRRFSFYHDRNRSEARIRNVVLRGDWPEKLTEEDLNDLLATRP